MTDEKWDMRNDLKIALNARKNDKMQILDREHES